METILYSEHIFPVDNHTAHQVQGSLTLTWRRKLGSYNLEHALAIHYMFFMILLNIFSSCTARTILFKQRLYLLWKWLASSGYQQLSMRNKCDVPIGL